MTVDILNDILACVSVALDALHPEYPVFQELVPDELPERCFLLGFAGEVDISHEMSKRYRVSGKLDIAYISPKRGDETNRELNAMFQELSLKLHHLSFGGVKIRLGRHTRRIVDDVLHDICDFTTFLYEHSNTPVMERLEQNPVIKE
jgi:hypothetical protein